MRISQAARAAGAALALCAGTAACTSGGAEEPAAGAERRPVATACANATFTWFDVERRDVLTGVSEKQELGVGGGRLTAPLRRVHEPATAVVMEKGRVVPEDALRALGAHLGDATAGEGPGDDFARVGRPAPALSTGGDGATVDRPGTYVEYALVRQVTARFRYTCGDGEPATGRATSWETDGSGVLECSRRIENGKRGQPALEAARLACGPGAPAATLPDA